MTADRSVAGFSDHLTKAAQGVSLLLAGRTGCPCRLEWHPWGALCSPNDKGPTIALARTRHRGPHHFDELTKTCDLIAGIKPQPSIAVLLLDEPITDQVRLSDPPSSRPRWVLATCGADGQMNCRGWGWKVDENTKALLDFTNASRILSEARIAIEQHFSNPSEVSLSTNQVLIKDADPDVVLNALHLIAEEDKRWRTLDIDDEIVICRRAQSHVETRGRLAKTLAFLRRLRGENQPCLGKLEETQVRLAVRASRYERQLEAFGQEEESLFAQARKTREVASKRAIVRKIAGLRRRSKEALQHLRVLGSQRGIIEAHLHHLKLVHAGISVDLPSREEIADLAARVEQILEDVHEVSGIAAASGDVVAGILAEEPEIDAILEELEARPIAAMPRQSNELHRSARNPEQSDEPPVAPPE